MRNPGGIGHEHAKIPREDLEGISNLAGTAEPSRGLDYGRNDARHERYLCSDERNLAHQDHHRWRFRAGDFHHRHCVAVLVSGGFDHSLCLDVRHRRHVPRTPNHEPLQESHPPGLFQHHARCMEMVHLSRLFSHHGGLYHQDNCCSPVPQTKGPDRSKKEKGVEGVGIDHYRHGSQQQQ